MGARPCIMQPWAVAPVSRLPARWQRSWLWLALLWGPSSPGAMRTLPDHCWMQEHPHTPWTATAAVLCTMLLVGDTAC